MTIDVDDKNTLMVAIRFVLIAANKLIVHLVTPQGIIPVSLLEWVNSLSEGPIFKKNELKIKLLS